MSCISASMSDAVGSSPSRLARPNAFRSALLACCALLILSACTAARSKIEPPTITLDSIRVGRVAEAKADVSLRLTLANHNEFELPIDRVEFDVTLDGRPAVTGRSVRVDPLPPGGEAKVELGGRVDTTAVATALMTLGSQLPVPYAVSGTLTLKNGTALGFSRNGEIPVMRFEGALGARP